jgi:hypothetical protein
MVSYIWKCRRLFIHYDYLPVKRGPSKHAGTRTQASGDSDSDLAEVPHDELLQENTELHANKR